MGEWVVVDEEEEVLCSLLIYFVMLLLLSIVQRASHVVSVGGELREPVCAGADVGIGQEEDFSTQATVVPRCVDWCQERIARFQVSVGFLRAWGACTCCGLSCVWLLWACG